MVVSVVMVTYGHEKFIKQSIEGVLMQDCDFDIELILANDCSPDLTDEVVRGILENHPKSNWIKYTKHPKNIGMISNFMWAAGQATAKYIALCDGDDYWTDPLKLQKQVDFLEENEDFSICGSLAKRIHEDLQSQDDLEGEAGVFVQKDLAQRNFIPTASALIKREHIVNLPSWFTDCPIGDWPLFLLCANHGKIKVFKEQMVVRRIHQGGVWSVSDRKKNDIRNHQQLLELFSILKDKFNNPTNDILNGQRFNFLFKIATHYIKNNNYEDFKVLISQLDLSVNDKYKGSKIFTNNLESIISQKNNEITILKNTIKSYKYSNSFKLGNLILNCLKWNNKK
jgi:glycosyltransferase involved in cell wall biosynthesis